MIDLAGSERASDSKNHTKARMDETKQINLSLMALKECIRARTMASEPGAALTVHVRILAFHLLVAPVGHVVRSLNACSKKFDAPSINGMHCDESFVVTPRCHTAVRN